MWDTDETYKKYRTAREWVNERYSVLNIYACIKNPRVACTQPFDGGVDVFV